jgi:hypothetical protein
LQDDKGDEVNALSYCIEIDKLLLGISIKAIRVVLKDEDEYIEGNPGVFVYIEEAYTVCVYGLYNTDKDVALHIDLKIDQVVFLVVMGEELEQIELLLFYYERKREEKVTKDADDDYEEEREQ